MNNLKVLNSLDKTIMMWVLFSLFSIESFAIPSHALQKQIYSFGTQQETKFQHTVKEEFDQLSEKILNSLTIQIEDEVILVNSEENEDETHKVVYKSGLGNDNEYLHLNPLVYLNQSNFTENELERIRSSNLEIKIVSKFKMRGRSDDRPAPILKVKDLIDQKYSLQLLNYIRDSEAAENMSTFIIEFKTSIYSNDLNLKLEEQASSLKIDVTFEETLPVFAGQVIDFRDVSYVMINKGKTIKRVHIPKRNWNHMGYIKYTTIISI